MRSRPSPRRAPQGRPLPRQSSPLPASRRPRPPPPPPPSRRGSPTSPAPSRVNRRQGGRAVARGPLARLIVAARALPLRLLLASPHVARAVDLDPASVESTHGGRRAGEHARRDEQQQRDAS